jgi:hypothetical protein
MVCSHCGASIDATSGSCPTCGAADLAASAPPTSVGAPGVADTLIGAPSSAGPSAASSSGSSWSGYRLDVSRLTTADRLVAGATVVLFVALFLPWFSEAVSVGTLVSSSGSVNGLYHGYMYLVLLVCLAILGDFAVQAGYERAPVRLPVARDVLLLAAGLLDLLLVVISFLTKPSAPGGSLLGLVGLRVSVGWSYGAYLGLEAAVVAVAPMVLDRAKQRSSASS